ncbi:hypothetical protein ACQ4PT_037644 [Festuca glaucescens]
MESSQRNGLRTPFQDLTNTGNAVQRPDPKELKRQQERERYARNKDEINKKWRESREQKKATSAILKENQTPSKTSLAISLGIPTVTVPSGATPFDGQNSLQSKQTASSNKENLHCDYYAIGSSRGCGLQPPNQALSSLEDKQALKRERENLRYELNKDVILQRLRETCHRKKAKCVLTSGEHTQLDTPVSNICATGLYTGKSAVIQLHQTPNIEDITTAGLQSFAPPIEQPIADEDCDWLHRNDTYQMQKIGGRMRPVNIPNAKPYIDTPMEKYIGNDHGEDAYGILEYLGSPLDYQTGYYINDCLDTLQHGEAEHPEPDEEARIFIEQDVAFESYQLGCHPSRATPVADTEEFVYRNLPKKHHVLKKVLDCQHCGALRFPFEGLAFCCRKGKVGIITPEVPKELKRFFTSQEDADAKYFRENIWYFNSHFSFTSLGVTLDRRVSTAARTGVYTFRACGGLYHAVDDLVPSDNGPRNLQLYIYDTDENLIHRAKRSPYLNIDIIRKILGILECNPYAQVLKSLGSVPNLDEYRISLNIDINLDQRRYNTPTTSQVAAIWVEGSDPQNCFDRSVVVHGKGDRPLYIREYYGCYDPLSCPLFFPCGETSWNLWMPYVGPPDDRTEHSMDNSARQQKQAFDLPTYDNLIREEQFMNFAPHKDQATGLPADNNTMQEPVGNDARHEDHATDLPEDDNEDNPDEDFGDNEVNATQSRKFVSAREYYCFKLQVRKKLFNIILFGGRLFQQWAVDMYIKIETMRLDWYSKPENQKVIRADLYQGLVDTIVAGESHGDRIGKRIVLPHTFPGGDRDMQRREACEHLGLIDHDKTLDDCMTEAATFQMPCALRRLFATILVFCEATEIRKMWDKHLASMSEDYHRDQSNEAELEHMVLRDIRDMLQSMGKDITAYGLPDLIETNGSYDTEYREVIEERQVTVDKEHLDLFSSLNSEQLTGFNDIMDHVTNQKSQIFFVDGPGGTGKTYLYKALLAKVRSMGLVAIATATSGIVASIMPGGRTAHSRFKIPIKLTDNSMCSFTKQSGTAELLKQASLIIWDEVAMTKRQAVETLDRSLQE